MKTITINANGMANAKPDTIIVNLKLETRDENYTECFNKANSAISDINKCLSKVGFSEQDLKTISFNVDALYENTPDGRGIYQKTFKGYCCYHLLKLEFGFDNDKLIKVINAINDSETKPRINLNFTIKNYDALIDEAITNATKIALNKAKTLCKASGSKLGQLVSITYDKRNNHIVIPSNYSLHSDGMARARLTTLNLTPDQMEINEPVTLVWEIESNNR